MVIERIIQAIDGLEMMPQRFRVAGRSRKRGNIVHSGVVRPFIINYRIDEPQGSVAVLEVMHGAREQPKRFE